MTHRRLAPALALALAGTWAGGSAQAALTGYASQASFLAAVSAPVVDTFDNLAPNGIPASPLARSVGGYGYVATEGPNYAYFDHVPAGANRFLPAGDSRDTVTFASFTGAPGAIGANFFNTQFFDNVTATIVSGSITVTATDSFGAQATQTVSGTTASTFLGFVSTGTIVSLAMSVPGQGSRATIDNLTFATAAITPAVPEPGSVALLAAGLGVIGLVVRRRR